MNIKYKIFQFSSPVNVQPGDVFTARFHLSDAGGETTIHEHSEDIHEVRVISHGALVSFGSDACAYFLGNDTLPSLLNELFPSAALVPDDQPLF